MSNLILYYAGIGSRETPVGVMEYMKEIASILAKRGWVLRSGGAPGADQAFEAGCDEVNGQKEIYLPWKGFEKNPSPLYQHREWTEAIASKYHPIWDGLSQGMKKLHSRNVCQIMGRHIGAPKSKLVICWTPDGCESHEKRRSKTGGTGQAISIASDYAKVPVVNLFHADTAWDRFMSIVTSAEAERTLEIQNEESQPHCGQPDEWEQACSRFSVHG